MKIQLLESAKEDLREGYDFYEKQSEGLGEYFLDCIQADIRSLTIFAGIHELAGGFHRMLSKRFPFAIFYLAENKAIDVYAILDCRRDPKWIANRLDDLHNK